MSVIKKFRMFVGLSDFLCSWIFGQSWNWHPSLENNRHLTHCQTPVLNRHCRLFFDVLQSAPDEFYRHFFSWESSTGFPKKLGEPFAAVKFSKKIFIRDKTVSKSTRN